MAERKYRLTVGQSIQTRLLAVLLGLTTVSVLAVAYLGISAIQSAGQSAQQTSGEALRAQAEEYLSQLTVGEAQRNDLILKRVIHDTENVARYAAGIFESPEVFAHGAYWQVEDHMFIGPDGQYINGEDDISSVFVPNFADIDDELLRALELGAHLDFIIPQTYESDPNTVAIYLGTKQETTRYYPNINLGVILPPDFQVTQRPWYTNATWQNNPEGKAVWSPVYEDATGKGLMVTAAAPIYTNQGEFVGVIGIDVTLKDISANVEASRLLGSGYSFLVDDTGHAIAMPEQGYRDILGRAPEPGELGTDLSEVTTGFAPVLAEMMAGSTGFKTLEIGGKELLIAYAPLESTGWSLASVVEAERALQAVAALQEELETSITSLVLKRILPVGGVILAVMAVTGLLLANRLVDPIQKLVTAAQQIGAGEWDTSLPPTGHDEIGVLSRTFGTMAAQIRELVEGLEQRVAERTADLERRSVQLETAAQVAREAAAIRDIGQLLTQTARLISERFSFYHAGIFLVDEAGEYAVLRAASSEGGQRMLARGHRLKVGEVGIVGYVAGAGQPRVALDVGADSVFFNNPDLPLTRSEMALPLQIRGRIIGVLDVQSTEEAAFSDEDVAILQTMADQVALAIENARLLEESQRALRELRAAYGEYARTAWEGLETFPAFEYDRVEVTPAGSGFHPGVEEALSGGQVVTVVESEDGRSTLTAPLRLRDQVIGAIGLEETDEARPWTEEEIELVKAVSSQVALALENARLFSETRQRMQELAMLFNASQALASAPLQPEEIAEIVARQFIEVMGVPECSISLLDPQKGTLRIVVDLYAEEPRDRVLREDVGKVYRLVDYPATARVIETLQPLVVRASDPDADPAELAYMQEYGTVTLAIIPLAVKGQAIGVIELEAWDQERHYTQEQLNLAMTLANQAAVALENARLFEQAQRHAHRERLIREITARVRGAVDIESILQTTVQEVGKALGASHGLVRLGTEAELATPPVEGQADSDSGE